MDNNSDDSDVENGYRNRVEGRPYHCSRKSKFRTAIGTYTRSVDVMKYLKYYSGLFCGSSTEYTKWVWRRSGNQTHVLVGITISSLQAAKKDSL
jgi:hypothetical protein